ncbi:MAG: anthranilate phosphoribosyltransferase [Chitinispirillaceae bacterium]|nr:anthranilate phosphoribosyltransferase [Chitinispirillaceae bacterium]
MSVIQPAIKKVVEGNDLSVSEAVEVFNEIMSGGATDAQIAALIVGLRMKGEAAGEITGAASVMREKALRIEPQNREFLVDTCGTGGDGADTFNISTAAALVAAAAGARVAKHGNRRVSSRCGSADVLEALGMTITVTPEKMKECLDCAGFAFLFAPALHSAMRYAIGPRKEIATRTIFNMLGPLTNPAMAPAQVIGVFAAHLTEVFAAVLKNLGSRHAFIVHGMDGLDEITLCGATKVSELSEGSIRTYTIQPEDFGIRRTSRSDIAGGPPPDNARIITEILDGKGGPRRDIVCLNAAFALAAAGVAATPQEGIEQAAAAIDSGAAKARLRQLVELTCGRGV